MERRTLVSLFSILFCQFDLALGQAGGQWARPPIIRTVPSDTLSDLAVAFADSEHPVIYYNPRFLNQYGAEIAAFVLAHEYAHIALGHRRPLAGPTGDALERLLQGWELDADCLAATRLARERPAALHAAISFFGRMALDRRDREHPTGSARAARLAACGGVQQGVARDPGSAVSGQGSSPAP